MKIILYEHFEGFADHQRHFIVDFGYCLLIETKPI